MTSKRRTEPIKAAKKTNRSAAKNDRPAKKLAAKGKKQSGQVVATHGNTTDSVKGHVPDPVVAYDVGRAFNRLRWWMVQAWLLGNQVEIDAEDYLPFDALAAAARLLVPEGMRYKIENFIENSFSNWDGAFKSEWRDDGWGQLNEGFIREWPGASDRDLLHDEGCKRFLGPVERILAAIHSELHDVMDSICLLSFELGQLIDGVLRPGNVWQHMIKQTEPATSFGGPQATDISNENLVADYCVQPGEIAPGQAWIEKVRRVASDLKIDLNEVLNRGQDDDKSGTAAQPGGLPQPGTIAQPQFGAQPQPGTTAQPGALPQPGTAAQPGGLPQSGTIKYCQSLFEDLHSMARLGVMQLRPRSPSRLTIDKETQIVTLDGRHYPIRHKNAFCFLKALIDANGKVVTRKQLRELGIRYSRPDRMVKKHIPQSLHDVIRGTTGKGGGYQILLPPLPSP